MSDQFRKTQKRTFEQIDDVESQTVATDSSLPSDLDDILDQIDSVLEQNAEEFVKSYIQKGGQ